MGDLVATYSEITNLTLWVYVTDVDQSTMSAWMTVNGVNSTSITFTSSETNQWKSFSWNGSWTQVQVDGMTVTGKAPTSIGNPKEDHIDAIYVDVTGTLGAAPGVFLAGGNLGA